MMAFAAALSPILRMTSPDGPMKTIPARSQALRKIGVLGKKAIAGVDRIRVCLSGGFQNGRTIEIAFLRGRRADPNGFIRQAHVQSAGIGIGKHRNGPVAHRFRRAGNAASDFAPVGDKDFLEWLKKHNGFAAVFATKPYVGQAAVPANREAAAMPKGLLRLRRSLHRKQQIRRLAPTVTDREIQRTFAILLEKFHKLRLLRMSELPDRREISTEGMKLPFIVVQEFDRDAGVILNERNRVLDQELPNLRKARRCGGDKTRFLQKRRPVRSFRRISGNRCSERLCSKGPS